MEVNVRQKLLRQGLLITVFISALLLFPSRAPSQTTFGSITGTVSDASGGAVPGAQLTVVNEDTRLERQSQSGASGVFAVTDLPPGPYSLRVEVRGFKSQERTGLVLHAREVLNFDIRLAVGEVRTAVEVKGSAPVINTETPSVGFVKAPEEFMQLPLTMQQGNSTLYFSLYNPGVGVNDSGNLYANGTRQIDMYSSNDGIVEMADPDGIGGGPIGPDIESLAELNYVLANASAEYKSPVNMIAVSKSGTNHYHGTLYYNYNSNALNSRNFFSSTVPFQVLNNFAVNFGGPIKKEKTFFFGGFRANISHGSNTLVANVPLPAWRTGDFSDLLSQGITITNPFTGVPFPNNQIPSDLISSVSTNLQNFFFPSPNYGPAGLEGGNWRAIRPAIGNFYIWDGRIDHNFSTRDTVFGRFSYHRAPGNSYQDSLPSGNYPVVRTDGNGVFSWTHSFNPNVLNEFRTGFSRNNEVEHPALIGSTIIQQAGIQGIITSGLFGGPVLNITGISTTQEHSGPVINLDTNFQFIDDLSWTKGAHSLKFGTDIIRDQINGYYLTQDIYGTYNFPGVYTGFPYADFLLGLPQTTSRTQATPSRYLRGTMWSVYAQDQFKATHRLTLSYGLRWEAPGPYFDKFGRIYSFDLSNLSLVVPAQGLNYINPLFPTSVPIVSATQAGYPPRALVDFRKLNFYPRLGVAYKLTASGKTVIRAGYGVFSDTIGGATGQSIVGGPFGGSESFFNSITSGVPLFEFPDPFVAAAGAAAPFQSVGAFSPHLGIPYTQQWNVTLAQQVGSVGLSVAYIGTHAVNLLYPRNVNQPPPSTSPFTGYLLSQTYSSIDWNENGGSEEYNALQVAATKTAGRNLIFSAGYTWARDLTDQLDNDWITAQTIQNQFNRASEWGNNLFTPTQRFFTDAVYALPFGARQRFAKTLPRLAEGFLGGWQISAVATLQTGQWYTPTFDGFDPSNTNYFGGRADAVSGVSTVPTGGRTINLWFNPAAFRIPGCPDNNPVCSTPANVGRFGNVGNDTLAGPAEKNLDFALMKTFRIAEGKTLQFQAVFTDIFNHPHFGYPASDISSPSTVGQITYTLGNYLGGSADQRAVNFALRLRF
jgi:hypothetical protein